MACGSCGGRAKNVNYKVTFKHDGSTVTLSSLPEVRIALANSPQGGTYEAVRKPAG